MLLSERRRKPEFRGSIAICTKVNEWAAWLYSRRLKKRLLFLFCVYLGGDFSTARVAGSRLRATPNEQEVRRPTLESKNNLQDFWLYPNSVTSIALHPLTVWEEEEHEVWSFRAQRRWRKKSETSRTLHWERFPWSVHPGNVGRGHSDDWDTADRSVKKKWTTFVNTSFIGWKVCIKELFGLIV